MKEKKRLDLLILEKYPNLSRNQVQSLILQKKVKVNDKVLDKAGTKILVDSVLNINLEQPKYVSRAGFKLEKALAFFNLDVKDLTVLDAGISTGGFTDCLLQRGAKKIYGIDVGYGQVHEKILKDPRLVLFEKTNLRNLEKLPELVDLVTLDLSFISVLKVIPAVLKNLKDSGKIIILIKPQFEAERKDISRGGIVRDESVHKYVIEKIKSGLEAFGLKIEGVTESPILGSEGNKEFLAFFTK